MQNHLRYQNGLEAMLQGILGYGEYGLTLASGDYGSLVS